MGVWDYGLLTNDDSQDYLAEFCDSVSRDIIEFKGRDSTKIAGSLAAAIGILMRLGPMAFYAIPDLESPPHFYPRLIEALSHNYRHFTKLPEDAATILSTVLEGKGFELASRPCKLEKRLRCALFGPNRINGMPFERSISILELQLFVHSSSRTYLAKKQKEVFSELESEVGACENVHELIFSSFGGALGLLVLLPFEQTPIRRVTKWRNRLKSIAACKDDENDDELNLKYLKNVEFALNHLENKASKANS